MFVTVPMRPVRRQPDQIVRARASGADSVTRMRRILAVLAVVAVAGLLPTTAASAGSEPTVDRLRTALERFMDRPDAPPGAMVAVQREGRITILTEGVGDLATGELVHPDDHMRAASVAKAIRGAGVLALVGQGVMSLDDTVAERAPKYAANWGDVTLRQLLQHTSGVPDFIKTEAAQEAVQSSPTKALPPDQLLDFVADEPLSFEPGSEYEYSNSDNVLVGLMAEQATGRSYDEILQTEVADKLSLTNTTLPPGVEMPTPYAHGYDIEDEPPLDVSEVLDPAWAWGSGGIVTTPSDLTRFIRGYVGGDLFGADVQAAQRDVVAGGSEPPGPGKNSAGLAVFRYETKCGTVWGHTGNTVGYTQFAAASADGKHSATVSITRQVGAKPTPILKALRALELEAVCTALSGA